eukprot:m.58985 g.58985  ORF g.58985 m.58985 type:complete len:481 (+) comp7856_c0_seq1:39-1481(+)
MHLHSAVTAVVLVCAALVALPPNVDTTVAPRRPAVPYPGPGRPPLSDAVSPTGAPTKVKRGLSGLATCNDATAMGLQHSWHYNWGLWPTSLAYDGSHYPDGTVACQPTRAAEFVPMFWGCGTNCTSALWPGFRQGWSQLGVKYILGFNEPDNAGQSNLAPDVAADRWTQLDDLAQSFNPPLQLVGPGMTHWGEDGGSEWLDAFLGNLTTAQRGRIAFLAQHDYSGNAASIVAKADAAYKKYGLRVWLTEFAVGSSADRPRNDAFMKSVLPALDAADSIARYAWFSARNTGDPTSWVYQSNLLNISDVPGWTKHGHSTCESMHYLSQHDSAAVCQAKAVADPQCSLPKTIAYQNVAPQNCLCANTSCVPTKSSWLDTYVANGPPPPAWNHTPHATCAPSEHMWLGQHLGQLECQAMAIGTLACSLAPTKRVQWEGGPTHNCYCQNSTTCTPTASTWLDTFTEPAAPPIHATLTSTGTLYSL